MILGVSSVNLFTFETVKYSVLCEVRTELLNVI
jgi:hypothetical protein